MIEQDLMQTWIPATMIAVLFAVIVLDSWWLARRAAKQAEKGGGDGSGNAGGGSGAKGDGEARTASRDDGGEQAWHEQNRRMLRARQGRGGSVIAAYWGPWLALTSLILGAGAAFYLIYPHAR